MATQPGMQPMFTMQNQSHNPFMVCDLKLKLKISWDYIRLHFLAQKNILKVEIVFLLVIFQVEVKLIYFRWRQVSSLQIPSPENGHITC